MAIITTAHPSAPESPNLPLNFANMSLNVGVVMLDPFQFIDAGGPIELLHMASREYLSMRPEPVPVQALDIKIYWIGPSLDSNPSTTCNLKVSPTCTFDDHPKLDILFIPGPPPGQVQPANVAAFIRRAVEETPVVMSDCTGPLVLAQLGLLDGKRATLNKSFVPLASQLHPKVQWQAKERWTVDGKFWTSGGAVAGMSMMIAFLKSDRFEASSIPDIVADSIEFEPEGQLR